jgi:ABC-type nickel/cobalt efflux system permease component RcnA
MVGGLLKVLKVEGRPVLYEPEDTRLVTVAAVAGAIVLMLVVFGGFMMWRNFVLRRKVARLVMEDSELEWTTDADSPIVKTVKYLQACNHHHHHLPPLLFSFIVVQCLSD